MLKQKIDKYYSKEYDLNCAETILYAANEEYDLRLEKNVLKTMAAFGGGMAIEDVCGAITGSLAVLGILFVEDRSHESEKTKLLSQEFFKRFEEKLGTRVCKDLKEKYRNDEIRCTNIIYTASEVLEDIINREKVNCK